MKILHIQSGYTRRNAVSAKQGYGALHAQEQGSILIFAVVLIFIVSLVILGVLGNATAQLRLAQSSQNRELAFHIAEAGANYYEWHLAHYQADYADGTGQTCYPCGPYAHTYTDFDTGQVVGTYEITIYPPPLGTTVATIQSVGYTTANPKTKRKVTVRYGIPSLAQYAFLSNAPIWIGNSEAINGQLYSNNGIRFDGTGNAPISSAKSTYTCTSTFGCSPDQTKPGIWGSAPAATQSYWQYPRPNIDFSTMTSDLAAMKTSAQSGGLYLPASNAQGYSLVFNSDNTVTARKVTSLLSNPNGTDVNGVVHTEFLDYNGLSSIVTYSLPANGIIFVEDTVWVEGTVSGRVTVAAAKLPYNPSSAPSILIPNNILYTAKDGSVSLGLISQKDILITYRAPSTLEVDAALIAQNGSAQLFYFTGSIKNSITIYGTVASFGIWTWSWVNGSGTIVGGYTNTTTTYDSNLLYGPPPNFPLSTSGYQQITWQSD